MFSSGNLIVLAPIFWVSDTFWVNFFSVNLGIFLFFQFSGAIYVALYLVLATLLEFLCETIWARRVLQTCSPATLSKFSSVLSLVTQSCLTLCNPVDCSPPGTSVHGDSPGKDTGDSCHDLVQGIFPTQGLNPGLLPGRQILYHLSYQGNPRILERAAYPFSRGFSRPRNWTFSNAGRFFTSWATSLVDLSLMPLLKHFG